MYEQKINGKHIPCVFSPGLCNANSYISKKYPDTKTQAYRGGWSPSLRRIIDEGSRVGHGNGSRVPRKWEKNLTDVEYLWVAI